MKFSLDEGQGRFFTALFGGATTLGLICAGIMTLSQYLHTRELEQENKKKDAINLSMQETNAKFDTQRPFYQKQLELCELASTSAGILATAEIRSKDEIEKARGDFWRLYWGPLGIVEESKVEGAMVEFGDCLNQKCGKVKSLSLNLAHVCRDLISKSWDLNLPPIDFGTKVEKSKPRDPPEGPGGN